MDGEKSPLKRFRLALVIALCGLGLPAAWSSFGLITPAGSDSQTRVFGIADGEALHSVSSRLDQAGLLPRGALFGPQVLVVYGRIAGVDRRIKSGEYDLQQTMTPLQILDKLVAGSVKTYAITLPEGWRIDQIATRLEEAQIIDAKVLIAKATDPEVARTLGVEANTLEGYLYPETYQFRRNTNADEILKHLVDEFKSRWTAEDQTRLEASGMSLHDVVTFASIVEKETADDSERPVISGVFHNRLRKGMRLQSDPTVIYGMLFVSGQFDGNIRKKDLRADTPYNTYTRAGLPPGPIASVSIDSIRAALNPADVDYLYFVSRNDGTHEFSKTLREHTNAVNRYQKRQRRKGS